VFAKRIRAIMLLMLKRLALALALASSIAPLSSSSPADSPGHLWSADHETGDLSQWYFPSKAGDGHHGGGEYDSGDAHSAASREQAHSGSWSAKMTIAKLGSPSSGTRLFRWSEPQDPKYMGSGLYYGAWFYFPTRFTLTADHTTGRFWNIFQFKSKHPSLSGGHATDPVWYLDVQNRATGEMYLTLCWWGDPKLAGPHSDQRGFRRFSQNSKDIPIQRWTHISVFLKQASDYSGRISVWQDGEKIFDESGVVTRYPDGDNQWSVNNYSDGLSPLPASIYVDDASISTSRH
jgi:hypothetical protein